MKSTDSPTTTRQKIKVWAEIQAAYVDLVDTGHRDMYLDNLKRARNALRKCVSERQVR